MDSAYERKPVADLPVPTGVAEIDELGVGAHYWIAHRDSAGIAQARQHARTCAERTRQVQRLHFHASGLSCAGEVHENVDPPTRITRIEHRHAPATYITIP